MSMSAASTDVRGLGARDIAALVNAGTLTPADVVRATLHRIDRDDRNLRAFRQLWPEQARAVARDVEQALAAGRRLPLAGVPLGVKASEGMDSLQARRLIAAGCIPIGATSVPRGTTWQTWGHTDRGPTVNPWRADRTPGGSSAGSAAAVAAGLVPLATGNDGAGSLRIPAAWCGIVGIKLTNGLLPARDQQFVRGLVQGRGEQQDLVEQGAVDAAFDPVDRLTVEAGRVGQGFLAESGGFAQLAEPGTERSTTGQHLVGRQDRRGHVPTVVRPPFSGQYQAWYISRPTKLQFHRSPPIGPRTLLLTTKEIGVANVSLRGDPGDLSLAGIVVAAVALVWWLRYLVWAARRARRPTPNQEPPPAAAEADRESLDLRGPVGTVRGDKWLRR